MCFASPLPRNTSLPTDASSLARVALTARNRFEWSQRDIRSFVGKLVFRGYETRLKRVAKLLPRLVKLRQRGARGGASASVDVGEREAAAAEAEQTSVAVTRVQVGVTKAFKFTLMALEKKRLWKVVSIVLGGVG